jgi:N-acetylglucosamine kinase-like BadF-type ATPase
MEAALPRSTEVIGIDVGGTKTQLALGLGMELVKERIVSTPSWRTHDAQSNAVALAALVRDWLGDEAMARPLAVGSHGCDSTELCVEFETELHRHFTGPVRVVNDAELLVPAVSQRSGIGLIAGTGSIAVSRDPDGRLLTAGGWGWVLGDEGGAVGLVREAARAALAALDRGNPPDVLARRLFAAFDVTGGAGLALAITTATSAAWLGARAIEVFRAADEGSRLAEGVITDAGRQLAGLVDLLLRRGASGELVVAAGTVLLTQDRLRDAFLAAMATAHPEVTVHLLDRPPVLGALALATKLLPFDANLTTGE